MHLRRCVAYDVIFDMRRAWNLQVQCFKSDVITVVLVLEI